MGIFGENGKMEVQYIFSLKVKKFQSCDFYRTEVILERPQKNEVLILEGLKNFQLFYQKNSKKVGFFKGKPENGSQPYFFSKVSVLKFLSFS